MQLFVSDLDGTLLTDDAVMDSDVAQRINALIEAGLQFTVATSRAYPSLKAILPSLSLNLPVIEQNGAIIRDFQTGETLYSSPLSAKTADAIYALFFRQRIHPVISALDGEANPLFYEQFDNPGMHWYLAEKEELGDRRGAQVRLGANSPQLPILSFTYLGEEEEIKRLVRSASEIDGSISAIAYSNPYAECWEVNIGSRQANKGDAIQILRRHIPQVSQVISFGDNDNDIPMFAMSDVAVAMANSPPLVKSRSTVVCEQSDENPVLRFLEAHLQR